MNDLLILIIFGLILFVLGILFLKREKNLYENAVITSAKLVDFYEYRSEHNITMYTMEVEYKIQDGTIIHTREQGGSSRKKYEIGTVFDIYYSNKKPELFIICGDNTRKYVLFGMIIVGLILMVLFGYMYFNGTVS